MENIGFLKSQRIAKYFLVILLGSVLLLSVIGYSIDQYYESSPVYLIIGLSLGILIGFYELYKSIFKS